MGKMGMVEWDEACIDSTTNGQDGEHGEVCVENEAHKDDHD